MTLTKSNIIVITAVAVLILCLTQCADSLYIQGGRLYTTHCEQCHMADGSGLQDVIPSIKTSAYLSSKIDSLPCLIRHGKIGYAVDDSILIDMPSNYSLTEYEINNIINYIIQEWDITTPPRQIIETEKLLNDCAVPLYRHGM